MFDLLRTTECLVRNLRGNSGKVLGFFLFVLFFLILIKYLLVLWPGAGNTNTKVQKIKEGWLFFPCLHFQLWQKALKLDEGTVVTHSLSAVNAQNQKCRLTYSLFTLHWITAVQSECPNQTGQSTAKTLGIWAEVKQRRLCRQERGPPLLLSCHTSRNSRFPAMPYRQVTTKQSWNWDPFI